MNTQPTSEEGGGILSALSGNDDDANRRLHVRLVQAAADGGLLDIAYRTIDTPVGPLLLAATELGLVRVAYARQDHQAVLERLAETINPRVLEAPARLDDAARQFDEYFARARNQFQLPLDVRLSSGFRRDVLSHLPDIGYGSTASYGELARLAGNPKAARAVGTACGSNPLPVVVPCHRVVRSDGTPGGYVGGAEAKRTLLTLESAA